MSLTPAALSPRLDATRVPLSSQLRLVSPLRLCSGSPVWLPIPVLFRYRMPCPTSCATFASTTVSHFLRASIASPNDAEGVSRHGQIAGRVTDPQ